MTRIIVTGIGGSGTTLLTKLLLANGIESVGHLTPTNENASVREAIIEVGVSYLPVSVKAILQQLPPNSFIKQPQFIRFLPEIDELVTDARFIATVRSPFQLGHTSKIFKTSMKKADAKQVERDLQTLSERAAKVWLELNGNLASFASRLPDRVLIVKYEDFVLEHTATCQTISTFLGRELETIKKKLDRHRLYERPNLRGTDEKVWKIVQPLAESLGYSYRS